MLIEIMYDYDVRAFDAALSAPAAYHAREWRHATRIARLEQKLSAARGRLHPHTHLAARQS